MPSVHVPIPTRYGIGIGWRTRWRPTIEDSKELWSGKESFLARKLLSTLYRRKVVFGLILLVVAGGSATYLSLRPTTFVAPLTILVRPLPLSPTVVAGPQPLSFAEEAAAVRSDHVASSVIGSLSLDSSVQELQDAIDVELIAGGAAAQVPANSGLVMRISYVAASAEEASAVVTSVARRYISFRAAESQRVLEAAQKATNDAIEDLSARVAEVAAELEEASGDGRKASEATLTSSLNALTLELETLHQRAAELQPNAIVREGGARILQAPQGRATPTLGTSQRIVYPLLLGLIVASGFIWLSERRRDRFVIGKEIEALGPPVLAWIPTPDAPEEDEDPLLIDAYARLRNAVLARGAGSPPRSVAIAGPTPIPDSTIARRLAGHLAEVSYKTTLLAAHNDAIGSASSALRGVTWPLSDNGRGLPSIPRLIDQLKESHEYVVIEGPPILENADGEMVVLSVDMIVVVIDAKSTTRSSSVAAIKKMDQSGRPILGIVVDRADTLLDHRRRRPVRKRKQARIKPEAAPSSPSA